MDAKTWVDLYKEFGKVEVDNSKLIKRLERPDHTVDIVLDTDTYNEIDDQFALAYIIKSPDKFNLKAIYAAPFHNKKSNGPKQGMERSYDEIMKVLDLMEEPLYKDCVYKGSIEFLPGETTPVDSDAARDLAQRAMNYTPENPLYVIAIAAITNVASALLINPEIRDRIVIIWLGGNALHCTNNREFNLKQDIAGARLIFGCGVALVQLPCAGVVSGLRISEPELIYHLKGKNKFCDYMVDYTIKEGRESIPIPTWSRVIWDVSAVAWFTNGLMHETIIHTPIPQYDHHYTVKNTGNMYKYVFEVNRDYIFDDLFKRLTK